MQLNSIIKKETKAEFEFKDGAVFELKYLDSVTMRKIGDKYTKSEYSERARRSIDIPDNVKIGRAIVDQGLVGWKGFKKKHLPSLNCQVEVTSEEDGEQDITFTKDNVSWLCRESDEFVMFITEKVGHFKNFADKQRQDWGKKPSSTAKSSTEGTASA